MFNIMCADVYRFEKVVYYVKCNKYLYQLYHGYLCVWL